MSHGACETEAEMFSVSMGQNCSSKEACAHPAAQVLPPCRDCCCLGHSLLCCLLLWAHHVLDPSGVRGFSGSHCTTFLSPAITSFILEAEESGDRHFVKDKTNRKQNWAPSCWLSPNLERRKEGRREGSKTEGQSGTLRSPALGTGAHSP